MMDFQLLLDYLILGLSILLLILILRVIWLVKKFTRGVKNIFKNVNKHDIEYN